jgi:uncharacterized membrane protein YqaE (UPF0057 family)
MERLLPPLSWFSQKGTQGNQFYLNCIQFNQVLANLANLAKV